MLNLSKLKWIALAMLVSFQACKRSPYLNSGYVPPCISVSFDSCARPPVPDYSLDDAWAALPWKKDFADTVPVKSLTDNQKSAIVDVFFVHPTLFLDKSDDRKYRWNADIKDTTMNRKVETSSILNQATVFNGSCRVFAPRYRQAHISAFFSRDKKSGEAALNLAYQDVSSAFDYYLKHFNKGRPFIIAGHSQGTRHSAMLIREKIEGSQLQNKLIAAYIIGMPVPRDFFKTLPVCDQPDQTGCFVTWATYREGFFPKNYAAYQGGCCVNPLSWRTSNEKVSRNENLGGITWKFSNVVQKINGAQINDGILWVDKPHVPGRMFISLKNYHVADYNLFWFNIRENVRNRVEHFLAAHGAE